MAAACWAVTSGAQLRAEAVGEILGDELLQSVVALEETHLGAGRKIVLTGFHGDAHGRNAVGAVFTEGDLRAGGGA